MSAKWRSLQHRHKYTYTSLAFPKSYTDSLDLIPSETLASFSFFSELKLLISLNSTYSQVTAVKDLAPAFTNLLSAPQISDEITSKATRLYLEILFLENSLPLHRTLISTLNKCQKFQVVINNCFATLCAEYGNPNRKEKKRFIVSRAALSLIGYPKLGILDETIESCSNTVALDIISGLESVLLDISSGSRPSPVVMEQCQEAMSCMYYLLQRYPSKFAGQKEFSNIFKSILSTILSVLKSLAFSRDCLVASGVSFCAAIQVFMGQTELSSFISTEFFGFNANIDRNKSAGYSDLIVGISDLSVLSRLCLLRGILTAIPRTVLNMPLTDSLSGSNWTILYDGILPELCNYCDNPIDSHFNFHALTVTQICLQQIKTSLVSDLTDFSGNYEPFSENSTNRILKIIWNNLEDPLSQTVKQVHLIFDLLLDIELSLPSNNEKNKGLLRKIALDLLCLGPRCKGRYIPLASLTKRIGANSLLKLNEKLIFETAYAYIDDDVCCAATSFLKGFLETLRDECWSENGIEKGYDQFRALSLPPLMQGLVSGHSKLRSNLNTYALPAILELDVECIFSLLGFISIGPEITQESTKLSGDINTDECITALVSLLKVSRNLALIEGDIDLSSPGTKPTDQFAVISIKGINVRVLVHSFVLSLTHSDESVRIDAAESLFLNPKTSSLPSSLELSLMRKAVPLNMRCSSTAFQMKWMSLFRKFFSRVKTALERQVKQGTWLPGRASDELAHRAESLYQFMKWLSSFLFYSCYPSAPYERKTMSMELILILLDTCPITNPSPKQNSNYQLYPYSESITSPDWSVSLVGSIVDSWDRLRENAFRILLCFPTPIPGISKSDSINGIISWAKNLVLSPRVRESDAGALTLRLVFKKYVLVLGCCIEFSADTNCLRCEVPEASRSTNPVTQYISSLVSWLSAVVEQGEQDLSKACKDSFVHGILLTLRYTFEELEWSSGSVQSNRTEMRDVLERLLGLIVRITSLALWVVSADVWYMPYDMDDVYGDDDDNMGFLSHGIIEEQEQDQDQDQSELKLELVERDAKEGYNGKPAEHVVMVGCWLAMKEISLLFGTIIRKAPLPSCTHSSPLLNEQEQNETMAGEMLDLVQLETMGNHFLQVLLKMKHNGAIDKTRAGFTALCNRLLCSNDLRLCKMTESWMEHIMERTVSKDQTVDDLLRRSAGIPAAFIALFLAEPDGTPKKLLPRALNFLINLAKTPLSDPTTRDLSEKIPHHPNGIKNETENGNRNGNRSKSRDEGVVPTVHAFNVLRAAFNDTNLAADTSGFAAEAMIVAVQSFASPYWEVRNAATLAYTALVRRMVGFLNVLRRESARRSLTGLEFFHRYPALHPFLSSELKIATEQLTNSNIAKAIHPSLCPILILLSRLKPSPISSSSDNSLDPFLLIPFIQKCATQSNLKIRVLASRALTGLVSNEKLHEIITQISNNLPQFHSLVSFNSIHGLLLQLSSLLDNNCRSLTDVLSKSQIMQGLVRVLSDCSWLGNTKKCTCPIVTSSYLRVLDLILDLSSTMGANGVMPDVQSLLVELTSLCLNTEQNSNGFEMYDPTKIELRKQAIVSYFNCLLMGNFETTDEEIQLHRFGLSNSSSSEMNEMEISIPQLDERIVSCVTDPVYEIRVSTMKKLLQLVGSLKPGNEKNRFYLWARANLQSMLMGQLFVEDNPKCVYYTLKIIFSWNIQFGHENPNTDSVFSFWDRLVQLSKTTLRSKTKEIILCCMGICMKQFVRLLKEETSTNFTKALKSIVYFINLVRVYSEPSQPVNIRRATTEALISSSLLEQVNSLPSFVSNKCTLLDSDLNFCEVKEKCLKDKTVQFGGIYACKILDLWFICVKLLEDEDMGLRQNLAKNVQVLIAKNSDEEFCDDSVPTQVDRVIKLCFEFLSSKFGDWLEYINYLAKWVFDTVICSNSRGDLVRQIFDKEIDNHHEEKLLICQICCSNLAKLVASNFNNMELFLQNWREKFLHQLRSFVGDYLKTEGKMDWIGGIGNHKDVFISVYANLLGLFAFSQYNLSEELGDGHKIYLSDLSDFREIIRPFLRNPMISNLYFLVVRSHEKLFGVKLAELDEQEFSVWDDFDPYFLLG